jgi:hypothetical protein
LQLCSIHPQKSHVEPGSNPPLFVWLIRFILKTAVETGESFQPRIIQAVPHHVPITGGLDNSNCSAFDFPFRNGLNSKNLHRKVMRHFQGCFSGNRRF